MTKKAKVFEINGGKQLSGKITTSYSKNGSVTLLCASLLNNSETTLRGISKIQDVYNLIKLIKGIGVKIEWIGENSLTVAPPKKFKLDNIDIKTAKKIRSVIMLIGPLAHAANSFKLPNAGGCKMGKRTIAAHRHCLEAFGGDVEIAKNFYKIKCKNIKANKEVIMYEKSDTATNNALMLAALAKGTSILKFAGANYQVQELCFFLEKMGIKISGIGTSTLVVKGIGKKFNKKLIYHNSEDPIEAMTLISVGIVTDSNLTIKRVPIEFVLLELEKLRLMGLKFTILKKYKAKNKRTNLVDLKIFASKLIALDDKIHALPYPGINIDNLPLFVPIAVKAKGTTLINDWAWENRAIYYIELNKLGGKLKLIDAHNVLIKGGGVLKASKLDVLSPEALRPAIAILVAMLSAKGKSRLKNTYTIQRGYENIVKKLKSIGADIQEI